MKTWMLIVMLLGGCFGSPPPRMMTTQELEQRGMRTYAVDFETGMTAAVTALKTLGFEVTVVSQETGVIKTAPREIMRSTAGANAQAVTYRDELGWALHLTAQGAGVQIKATPHAYSNGNPIPNDQLPAQAIDPKFSALWNELDQAMITARAGNGEREAAAKP